MGTVVSDKMDKTVVVVVERLVKHHFYHKYVKRRTRFIAHDGGDACQMGDKVMITESRPLSKPKNGGSPRFLKKRFKYRKGMEQ